MTDELRTALYDIAQTNAFSEQEYRNLRREVDETIDRVARTTKYDKTGEQPSLEYGI